MARTESGSMTAQSASAKRKVSIVENHPLVRAHLGALIEREVDRERRGGAGEATTALGPGH